MAIDLAKVLASAYLDMQWHTSLPEGHITAVAPFEATATERFPKEVPVRYRFLVRSPISSVVAMPQAIMLTNIRKFSPKRSITGLRLMAV